MQRVMFFLFLFTIPIVLAIAINYLFILGFLLFTFDLSWIQRLMCINPLKDISIIFDLIIWFFICIAMSVNTKN